MGFLRKLVRGSSRGAAALELSLSMPLVLTVVFGTAELGRGFVVRDRLVSAAAEAARVASQSSCPRPTEAQVLAAGNATLASEGLDPGLANFVLSNPGGESGTDAVVSLTYQARFPLLARFMGFTGSSDGVVPMTVMVSAENE